jgi:hypothetical protein
LQVVSLRTPIWRSRQSAPRRSSVSARVSVEGSDGASVKADPRRFQRLLQFGGDVRIA